MRKKSMITIILVCGYYFPLAKATTIKVPSDKPTIQVGINAGANGDTIVVEPGVYVENVNFNGKNLVVGSFFILSGDTSYISKTVIRGNNTASVVTFVNGEDFTAVLSGFTITGGLAEYGGGVFCLNSTPTLTNVTIMNNISYYYGGGLYCSNSSPTMTDVKIMNNRSDEDAGGICCLNSSNPKIRNAIIINNTSRLFGGGIACYDSNPILNNVVIAQNSSFTWYGGGLFCDNSSPILRDVLITKNKVYESVGVGSGGGGISCVQNSNPYLSNVTISRNSAKVYGGGIFVDYISTVIFDNVKRCNIYLNDATVGYDIYSEKTIHVVVDTFTVMNPGKEHAFPLANFTFDILHAKVSQDHSTLYVSPEGDNENSGLSWDEPLKTIGFAKSIIHATSQSPATIYLDAGTYSRETNGEHFELEWRSHVSLKGSGVNQTILKSDNDLGVLFFSEVSNVTIEDLTIRNGGFGLGGAIYCNRSDPVLKNIIITDCNSIQGGAINSSFNSNLTLVNVLIFNNSASQYGGALYGYHAQYNLVNVTMVDNTAKENGSGIYCQATDINLVNSILWYNLPDQVYFYHFDSPSSVNVAHSNIENGQEGISDNGNGTVNWLHGNIETEPLFANLRIGDFHLMNGSPCIGAGIDSTEVNGSWFFSPNEDIEHAQRPNPAKSKPDMGTYENQLDVPTNVVDDGNAKAEQFTLFQNYPNPFNPATTISFGIPVKSLVSLKVFDVLGREVATILSEELPAGNYARQWNAENFPGGVYFYRLQAGNSIKTKKLLLLR